MRSTKVKLHVRILRSNPLLFETLQAKATVTLGIHWKRGTYSWSALGSWEFSGRIQTVSYLSNSSGYSWSPFVGWKQAPPARRSASLDFWGWPPPQNYKITPHVFVFQHKHTRTFVVWDRSNSIFVFLFSCFSNGGRCYYWARCHGLEKAVWLKPLSWRVMNGAAGQH